VVPLAGSQQFVNFVSLVFAKMTEKNIAYPRVNLQAIESLPPFLETAAQSSPDLFLVYHRLSDFR
jgi:hypothetical protein